jgi:large subunit ribosomal protein L24e
MKCSFCGEEIEKGVGKVYAFRDGSLFYFCSSKCEKNLLKLKRKPQKVKWTKRYHAEKAIRVGAAEKKGKPVKAPEKKDKEEGAKPEKKEEKGPRKREKKAVVKTKKKAKKR